MRPSKVCPVPPLSCPAHNHISHILRASLSPLSLWTCGWERWGAGMFFNGRASGRAWITFQDALAASKALALDDTGRSVFASLSVLI
jgi:hypothetical protein